MVDRRSYHLAMMPGAQRKARLLTDWTTSLLFSRDASELGQLGHPPTLATVPLEGQSSGGTGEDGEAAPGPEQITAG